MRSLSPLFEKKVLTKELHNDIISLKVGLVRECIYE